MSKLFEEYGKYITNGIFILIGLIVLKKILNFLGFSNKFRWGWINYWVVKKSHKLTMKEMKIIKDIAESFRITTPSYIVGTLPSLDHYLGLYVATVFNKKNIDIWGKIRLLSRILEIRRKFAVVPLSSFKIKNTRQFAPGTKIKIAISDKGYFESIIGDSRYSFFSVIIKDPKIASFLKSAGKVSARVSRLGDAQYYFKSKVLFVSTMTNPMFVQLKHTRKLKRKQFRSDIRVKTNIFTDIVPTNPQKTKKGYVFVDGKEKYSGLIVNISSGGAAVQSRAPIQVGSYYRIRFKILGEELEIPSKVVLERRAGPNTPDATFHLRFVGISVRARVFIQLYAYKLHPSFFAKSQKIKME